MISTKEIIVPRGQNVGNTIKTKLQNLNIYKRINILTFDFKRDPVNKVIAVSITYKPK